LRARSLQAQPADFYASLGNLFYSAVSSRKWRIVTAVRFFLAISAPFRRLFPEIMAHAGSDPPASNFTANVDQYKSQYLQDILLDRWISAGSRGHFRRYRRHDGVAYSNSFVFEKLRAGAASASTTQPHGVRPTRREQAMHNSQLLRLRFCRHGAFLKIPAIRRCCPHGG